MRGTVRLLPLLLAAAAALASPADGAGTGTGSPPAKDRAGQPPAKASSVRLLGVEIGAGGNFILVHFTCHPRELTKIYQGSVSVTDQATGFVYNEVAVMPKIGPLIGRPTAEGQRGYVMIVNPGVRLRPGAKVDVAIGDFRKEGVTVQGPGAKADAPAGKAAK